MKELSTLNVENRLRNNTYPGRGIIIGKSNKDQWIQVYWIMGRSENSRNRIFVLEDGILKTQAADPGKVEDPSLIIYNAMQQVDGYYIVTNGSQTDTIYDGIKQKKSFAESLLQRIHEPDAPNYTPRISGILVPGNPGNTVWLSVIKASPFDKEQSEHHYFRYSSIPAGFGYAVTTYKSDGNPIPSFEGSPYVVPLEGKANEIADFYWNVLNEANRISLAVRIIDSNGKQDTVIINKHR